MKVLMLKVGEKTHTTGKITAYLSREALKIQTEAIQVAKTGMDIEKIDGDINAAGQLMQSLLDLRDRKSWLICQVYNDTFTFEELENELSSEEIDAEINRIISGISGTAIKN